MLRDFKTFLLRGNVVDLAVGIVIGVAFGAVVTALVKDLITPIIAAIIGKPDFSALKFTVNKSTFLYGDFINALIAFISIAAAVFFFVVRPVNALMARRKTSVDVESETRPCSECLSEIPRQARKCAFCGSPSKQPDLARRQAPTESCPRRTQTTATRTAFSHSRPSGWATAPRWA